MSFRIQWSASALDRLIGILDFIAKDNPLAASEVVDDLLARVDVLSAHPRIGPAFSDNSGPDIRRLILDSYVVIYQIHESRRVVSVLAVRHARQQPLTLEDLGNEI